MQQSHSDLDVEMQFNFVFNLILDVKNL